MFINTPLQLNYTIQNTKIVRQTSMSKWDKLGFLFYMILNQNPDPEHYLRLIPKSLIDWSAE